MLIFQHTGHFVPSALIVSTEILSKSVLTISAEEVIQSSAKLIPLSIFELSLSTPNLRDASKLEPISFVALFSSIAILAFSLILKSFSHFLFKVKLEEGN